MTVNEYLSAQEPEKKELLSSIHKIILKTHKKITAEVGKMMGTEMILYKVNNNFAYGLASQKNYMCLHAIPIYICKPIYEKYSKLLKKAKFQKGCVNFNNAGEMPLDIAEQFLAECSKIDLEAIMKKHQKAKK